MNTQSLHKQFLSKRWLSLPIVILLILIGLGGATAFSQASDDGPIAVMVITTTVIKWKPQVEHDGMALTVTGPEDVMYQQVFTPKEIPTFGLVDSEGKNYPDGSYTYELVAKPVLDAEEREALEEARETGDSVVMPRQVQSGHFTISGGKFLVGTVPEAIDGAVASPEDEVIYDDLIVDGSLCVGNDCYSGLAFGFDTIVMMENNLRIYFDDTSNTSSFPSNDWRIIINDTTDGGGSYFAVQDVTGGKTPFTIEADAKTNSLYVDDDGQVGIGTSGPVFELHIKEGDTPTVRLHQSTSYGWPEQIWDVGGNETSFFIRDGTHAARLPFRIEPGTPSSTLSLKSNGRVGIGTWSPGAQLEVETTGSNASFWLERTDGATAKIAARGGEVRIGSATNHLVRFTVDDSPVAALDASGNLTIDGLLTEGSDVNSKENFVAVDGEDVLASLVDVSISTWNYKTDEDGVRHMGPMAQDFYAVYGLGSDDKHISVLDVGGVALAAIKELDARNEALETENTDLEARVAALEALVAGGAASTGLPLQGIILLIAGLILFGVILGLGLSVCLIRMARRDSGSSLLKVGG